jgi:predicted negative regulator of RcsB-dependent stress response
MRSDDKEKHAAALLRIAEAIEILKKLEEGADRRWLAQYLTLEGRLLIVKGDLTGKNGAEAKIDQAISLLNSVHGHRTYLVEALVAKSRVLMEQYVHSSHKSQQMSLLNKAEDLLLRAQRENLNTTDGVPENNQIEAIVNFALARIKIRQGDRSAAEERLRIGSKHLPIIESDGVQRLFGHAKRELSEAMFTFRVVNDLDLDKNSKALRVFILKESIGQARIRGQKPWDVMNTSRATFYNLLKENRLKWKE